MYQKIVMTFLITINSLIMTQAGNHSYRSGVVLFISMFNNLALFIILVAMYGVIAAYSEKKSWLLQQILLGVLFGLFVYGCMNVRIPVAKGVLVDQRNAVVILAGWFGGPLAALIAGIIAAIYRAYLGGSGVIAGIFGLGLATTAGSILYRLGDKTKNIWGVLLSSLAATIFIMPGFLLYKSLQEGWNLMIKMFIPFGSAILLGVFIGSVLLVRENNRRQTQRSLEESEQRYRKLFDSLIDISYQSDKEGHIILVSPSCKELLGYTPEEMIGKKTVNFYKDPLRNKEFIHNIQKKGHIKNFEVELIKKDGTVITVSANVRVIKDATGCFNGVEGILRDITRLKKANEEKQLLEENLRQSQKMESIGNLAGGIAHDFNNILTAILGYAELSQIELPEEHPVRENIDNIISAGTRAKEIVNHILIFSRKTSPQKKAVQYSAIIQDALVLLKALVPSSISVNTTISAEEGIIFADPNAIYQVILNICTNAAQAMEEREGAISIKLERTTIASKEVSTGEFPKSGPYLVLSIKDQGSGIKPEFISRIFEPYFTTKTAGKGTGMGLSVVHGIITEHEGNIKVASEPGKGTTFQIFLPEIIGTHEEVITTLTALPKGNERILLVDDEVPLLDLMKRRLEHLGYRVTTFEKSKTALETFIQAPDEFDLLITDQVMPELTGNRLIKEFKKIRHDLPIILCSGYKSPQLDDNDEKANPTEFVMKPVQLRDLAEVVRKAIDRPEDDSE